MSPHLLSLFILWCPFFVPRSLSRPRALGVGLVKLGLFSWPRVPLVWGWGLHLWTEVGLCMLAVQVHQRAARFAGGISMGGGSWVLGRVPSDEVRGRAPVASASLARPSLSVHGISGWRAGSDRDRASFCTRGVVRSPCPLFSPFAPLIGNMLRSIRIFFPLPSRFRHRDLCSCFWSWPCSYSPF